MLDIKIMAEPLLKEKTSPYVLVAMQECGRMNTLLTEIRRTLTELKKGLDGQLNMTEAMEDLAQALSINQVPGRNPFHKTSWEAVAWPSRKNLSSWFRDLLARYEQMAAWSSDLIAPKSLWLPGLFNPMAFLTAIMQVVARQTGLPLDNMAIDTHFTTIQEPEEVEAYPKNGMFCHGLYMEGARYGQVNDEGKPVGEYGEDDIQCAGYLMDSRLKELHQLLPVVYLKAVEVQPEWDPTSVGYMRCNDAIYDAPLYVTTFRGPTYVTLCTLKSIEPTEKWILAGVALVMQLDD
jgi:dynein heavy chain